jgi:hypothetical protein
VEQGGDLEVLRDSDVILQIPQIYPNYLEDGGARLRVEGGATLRIRRAATTTARSMAPATSTGWGWDNSGQASAAPGGTFAEVSGGLFHSCALDTAGDIACWGRDDSGQVSDIP